jgi:hypothetical protein
MTEDTAKPTEEEEAKLQTAQMNAALAMIQGAIRQVMGVTILGMRSTFTGINPQALLNMIAWQTGNLLAGMFQADLAPTLMIRKGIIEAFTDGVKKSQILPPPGGVPLPPLPKKNGGN